MFFGREEELNQLDSLWRKRVASLVTCRGRRRIGKSALIEEFAHRTGARFIKIEGKRPQKGWSNATELQAFAEQLAQNAIFFGGNGSAKCKQVITNANATFVHDIFPLAENMARIAQEKYEKQQFESVAYFEPFYLKEFIATVAKNKVL